MIRTIATMAAAALFLAALTGVAEARTTVAGGER